MTQCKFKIKKGDLVQVTAGRDKGKQGTVLKMLLSETRAVVDGVNVVTRNQKPSATAPGGPVKKNLPIHLSNIMLVDSSTGKPGRVGYKEHEGKKVRFFKKSGTIL